MNYVRFFWINSCLQQYSVKSSVSLKLFKISGAEEKLFASLGFLLEVMILESPAIGDKSFYPSSLSLSKDQGSQQYFLFPGPRAG